MTSPISGIDLSSIDVTELPKHENVNESKDIAIQEVAVKALESGSSASSNNPIKRASSSLSGLNWIQRAVLRILGMKKENVRKMDELEGQLKKLNKLMQQSAKRAQKQARSSRKQPPSLRERNQTQHRLQTTLDAIKEIKNELGSREDVQQLQKENLTLCQGLTQKYDKILLRTELFEFNVKVHEQLNKGKNALRKTNSIKNLENARTTYETAQEEITKELAHLLQTMLQSRPEATERILKKNGIDIPSGELDNKIIDLKYIEPKHLLGLMRSLNPSLASYYKEISEQIASLEKDRYSSIEATLKSVQGLEGLLVKIGRSQIDQEGNIQEPSKKQVEEYKAHYQKVRAISIDANSVRWAKEYAARQSREGKISEATQQQLAKFESLLGHLLVLKVEERVFERLLLINEANMLLKQKGVTETGKKNIKDWIGGQATELLQAAILVYQQNESYQGLSIPSSEVAKKSLLDNIFAEAFPWLAPAIQKALTDEIDGKLIAMMPDFAQRVEGLLVSEEIPEMPSIH